MDREMSSFLSVGFGVCLFLGGAMVVQDQSLAPVLSFQLGCICGLLFMARVTW